MIRPPRSLAERRQAFEEWCLIAFCSSAYLAALLWGGP
jgi:hypothetical protein